MKKNFSADKFFALVLSLALSCGILNADDFFKNNKTSDLPADKLYPQGRIFPFSGYSPPSVTGMKKLGFSATGPTYGGQAKLALDSQKEGLPNIWQLHAVYDGIKLNGKPALAKAAKAAGAKGIDWIKMQKCVEDAVKDAIKKSNNNIAWWALGMEEIRWWNKNEVKFLAVAYKAIKNADPEKRPMWVYMPGHYGFEGMRKYMPNMDMLAQGYYPSFGNRAGFRYWCENVQKTVAGFQPERPMLAVTEMFREPKEEVDRLLIPAFVRHDVWMAIIHGFKGIVVFSFGGRANFDSYGDYFFAYSEVAGEITRPGGLGDVIITGEVMNDIKIEVTEGPATVLYQKKLGNPAKLKDFIYPAIKWRDMRHNSGRYCFAASSSREPVKAVLSGLPKQPLQVINAANGKVLGETSNGTFQLEFGPYGVQLLKFEAK